MMVSDLASVSANFQTDKVEGTGLTDGYPPDGVDGHEVRVLSYAMHSETHHV
jgi:hypothetical protein